MSRDWTSMMQKQQQGQFPAARCVSFCFIDLYIYMIYVYIHNQKWSDTVLMLLVQLVPNWSKLRLVTNVAPCANLFAAMIFGGMTDNKRREIIPSYLGLDPYLYGPEMFAELGMIIISMTIDQPWTRSSCSVKLCCIYPEYSAVWRSRSLMQFQASCILATGQLTLALSAPFTQGSWWWWWWW